MGINHIQTNTKTRNILLLSANPKNTSQLRLASEMRDIKEGLRLSENRDLFSISIAEAVRPRDIRRAILTYKPQIIHFSGHGSPEEGLLFEDETGTVNLVDGEALASLFKLFANQVECVVLNACYSKYQASEISQHINYVVGMSQEIQDKAAIEFAVGFYDGLGAGESYEFAHQLGCSAIQMAGIKQHLIPNLIPFLNSKTQLSSTNLSKDNGKTIINKKQLAFAIAGSIDEINQVKLEAILALLKKISGDASVEIIRLEEGSIKLILEGSEEGLERIKKLFDSGELTEVLGSTVESVKFNQENAVETKEKNNGSRKVEGEVNDSVNIQNFLVNSFRKIFENINRENIKKDVDKIGIDKFISHCALFAHAPYAGSAFAGFSSMIVGAHVDVLNVIVQQFRVTLAVIYEKKGVYTVSFPQFMKIVGISLGIEIGTTLTKSIMFSIANKIFIRLYTMTPINIVPIIGSAIGMSVNYIFIRDIGVAVKKIDMSNISFEQDVQLDDLESN